MKDIKHTHRLFFRWSNMIARRAASQLMKAGARFRNGSTAATTEKDLMGQLYPGVDPEFYTDTDMTGGREWWERMTLEQRTCVFCGRDGNQTEGIVYSATAGHAICTDCIDEARMVADEDDDEEREVWHFERFNKWEKDVVEQNVIYPPPPHRRKGLED
jgi:hypothetical protein